MSERDDPYREPYRPAGDRTPEQGTVQHGPDDWREQTTPGMAPVPPPPPGGGRPYPQQTAPYARDPSAGGAASATAPDYTGRSVAFRRPDVTAGLLLVLAGVAAGVSLLLRWVAGSTVTGWALMRSAGHQLRTAPAELVDSGLWQPAAAVVGGGLLLVLGLLLFIPARAHRTLGFLALLVSIAAAVAVVVAIEGAHWHVARFQIGFWFAAAVPVLGVIGALKALFTAPRY